MYIEQQVPIGSSTSLRVRGIIVSHLCQKHVRVTAPSVYVIVKEGKRTGYRYDVCLSDDVSTVESAGSGWVISNKYVSRGKHD
jgi:hypothetical protein